VILCPSYFGKSEYKNTVYWKLRSDKPLLLDSDSSRNTEEISKFCSFSVTQLIRSQKISRWADNKEKKRIFCEENAVFFFLSRLI